MAAPRRAFISFDGDNQEDAKVLPIGTRMGPIRRTLR